MAGAGWQHGGPRIVPAAARASAHAALPHRGRARLSGDRHPPIPPIEAVLRYSLQWAPATRHYGPKKRCGITLYSVATEQTTTSGVNRHPLLLRTY